MLEEHRPGVLLARIESLVGFDAHQQRQMRQSLEVEASDMGPVSLVLEVKRSAWHGTVGFWLGLIEDSLLKSLALVSPSARVRLLGRALALTVHEHGLQLEIDTFSDLDDALEWASAGEDAANAQGGMGAIHEQELSTSHA